MPQVHRLNLFTKSPIGQWRCPKCGLPMFLACIEPAVEVDYERRTFECSTCSYGETIAVNFRIDRGDAVHQKGLGPRRELPGPTAANIPTPDLRRMPTKLQLLRKEQNRRSRGRPRGRRPFEEALRKESEQQFYGKLGPASPAKRIDPKTGEVVEIISTRE
jgi:hypothetical protein